MYFCALIITHDNMKKLFIALIAIAAACTPFTPQDSKPSDDPATRPEEPSDNPSDEPSGDAGPAFDPTGAVKTVTKETWIKKTSGPGTYMISKVLTEITYDNQGRPEKEEITDYGYDEDGQLLPGEFGTLKRRQYYFYSPGKMEIRQHPEEETVFFRADLDSKGHITHYEYGHMQGGPWTVDSQGDHKYMNNPDLEGSTLIAVENMKGRTAEDGIPWEFTWNADGNLVHAHQKWGAGGPADPTDDGSRYYFYADSQNLSLGKAYDISGLLIDSLDPYGFRGRGTADLPVSANTTYRNNAMEFEYEFYRTGPLLKATVTWHPFPDDGGAMASVIHTYVYNFTYYE